MSLMILILSTLAASQSAPDSGYEAAYEQAFRASFREHSNRRCAEGIKATFPDDTNANHFCACVTGRLLATKTVAELNKDIGEPELKLLAIECFKANPSPDVADPK